jgi:hypothetical protein
VIAILVALGIFLLGKNALNFLSKTSNEASDQIDSGGTVYDVESNKLTREENVTQIRANITEFLTAQKGKDSAKILTLLEKNEGLDSEYLGKYFKDSSEIISSFQVANIDFLLEDYNAYPEYPSTNKATVEVILDRKTSYGGSESSSIKVPVLYDNGWRVVATADLIPKKLESISVSMKPITVPVKKSAIAPAYTAYFKLAFKKVAVFQKKIMVAGSGVITQKNSFSYFTVDNIRVQDDLGGELISLDKNVKSGLNGNFYEVYHYNPDKEIGANVKSINYSFEVIGINIPKIGRQEYGKKILTIKF